MASNPLTSRIIKGRYQITKNVFSACYLEVLNASDQELRAVLGIKKRSDTVVPIGTRIYFQPAGQKQVGTEFESFSITVQKVDEQDGNQWLICSPINRETFPDRRKQERTAVTFPVLHVDSQTVFNAKNATKEGLTLTSTTGRALMKLTINKTYDFKMSIKGQDCILPGTVKHIHYDWRSYQHEIGVHFSQLSKDEQIMMNFLIDPDYTVPISDSQTVDTAAGKISF